jgi:hypothetical protein
MDIISISSLAQLGQEAPGTDASTRAPHEGKRAGGRTQADTGQRGGITPEQLYRTRRLSLRLLAGYHGLNPAQAQEVLRQTAAQIAASNPWRLAEIQAVTAEVRLTSAYA